MGDTVREATDFVLSRLTQRPSIAIILGSGLGEFAEHLQNQITISASEVPHFPPSRVEGHAGRIVTGNVKDGDVISDFILVFQGRPHYYESGNLEAVLFPTRLALALGISTFLVTNAAGGINRSFQPGDLMLIRDTLNFSFLHAPTGTGTFPHFAPPAVLDSRLRHILVQNAEKIGITLREGVYCWLKGPSYETAAEIEMLARLGADAVGMSTVPELLLAASSGIRTAGLSLISNLATGRGTTTLSHDEVTQTGERVKNTFLKLLSSTLLSLKTPSQA
ncbi:MAG: purine-nucleoside phosphorylase [Ignavibacteriales bacterium]|nr:purine-nucleoside phosphorylase [Ignavibacteriales bacterium]